MERKLIKLTHPLPPELLAAMKELSHTIVNWDSPDKVALYGFAKGFYGLITDEKHWETIILCMMSINDPKTSLDFEYEIKELSCKIPSILVQDEQHMEVFYMYDMVFSKMPLSTRSSMARALTNLMTNALTAGHKSLIEKCIEWSRNYMPGILKTDLLKIALIDKELLCLTRCFALQQIANKETFDDRLEYSELKHLCISAGLPLSVYLSAVAENDLLGRHANFEFANEVENFGLLKNEDFNMEDIDIAAICRAVTSLISVNGDDTDFEKASSGIGLINSVYDKCCSNLKGIIQESLVEVKQLIAKQERKTVIVTSLPLGTGLRYFSTKEQKLLDGLIAKKEEKLV